MCVHASHCARRASDGPPAKREECACLHVMGLWGVCVCGWGVGGSVMRGMQADMIAQVCPADIINRQ